MTHFVLPFVVSGRRMPFYSTNSGAQLGTYSDGGIRYGTSADDECVVTGAFNFYPFVNGTKSDDQINVAYVKSEHQRWEVHVGASSHISPLHAQVHLPRHNEQHNRRNRKVPRRDGL